MTAQTVTPLTLSVLDSMIKDPRYRNLSHPDHSEWIKLVTKGFHLLFPETNSGQDASVRGNESSSLSLFSDNSKRGDPAVPGGIAADYGSGMLIQMLVALATLFMFALMFVM